MEQLVDQDKVMEISYHLLSLTKQTWLGKIPPKNIFLLPNSMSRHRRVASKQYFLSASPSLHAFPLPWCRISIDHHYFKKYSPALMVSSMGCSVNTCSTMEHLLLLQPWRSLCCFFPLFSSISLSVSYPFLPFLTYLFPEVPSHEPIYYHLDSCTWSRNLEQ